MSSSAYTPLSSTDPDTDLPSSTSTVAMALSPDRIVQQKLGRPSNTMVVMLHTAFKLSALIIYLCASILTSSFIACFITVMILLSADFWIVKNLSGRLLAGLRWWSVVDDSGQLVWQYESWTPEQRQLAQRGETTYFWATLIGCQVVWTLLATVSVFSLSLKWLLLCCLALSLNGSNLLGYTRARLGTGEKITRRMTQWLVKTVLRRQTKQEPEQ